jgi:type I restriction enzyme S subunit
VSYGFFDPRENKVVLPAEIDRLAVSPRKDSIIICRSNTPELVGASAYIDRDYENLFLPDTLWRLLPRHEGFSVRWLSYSLNTAEMRWRIQNIATGTSANMKKINMRNFRKLKLLCPPLPEQRAIAAILSTWDETMTLTERLIAVLQARKRGLMQRGKCDFQSLRVRSGGKRNLPK